MSRSAHPPGPRYADALPEGHYTAPPPALYTLDPRGWSRTSARSPVAAAGVGRIVLDSFQEIVRVADIARKHGKRQRVQIRVTVGVEAHTHEFIATAHEDQKFGFSLSGGDASEAVRRVLTLPSLELIGIH